MATVMLTQAEVAERWKCTERMVRELWTRREIEGVKIGRLVRYPLEGIERYEAARSVQPMRGPLARGVA